ncbi:MAG: putative secreted lipase [Labilithrix sp.]|nr:putative secreted lipase [Labilithrix sp.]
MRPDDAIPPLYGSYSDARTVPSTFRSHLQETVATLREVVLMPWDITPIVPVQVAPQADVIVLVHGFFASAGVFRPMSRRLVTDTGAQVASFTHAPGARLERIARSLAKLVDRIPQHCRVHLIGHSLGGLVARWYVQELGGHERVSQTISLGSPFGGTERARRFPFLVGADLCRTSPTLARLRARAHEHDVPHLSVVGDADALIIPRESAVFPRGEVVVLKGRGHNSLLFDPESIRHVVGRVKSAQEAAGVDPAVPAVPCV